MPHNYPSRWNDDAVVETLKLKWLDGFSASQCAAILHRDHGVKFSRNAVIGKIYRLGLKRDCPSRPTLRKAPAMPKIVYRRGPAKAVKPLPPPKPLKVAPVSEVIALAPRHWTTREFGECAWPVEGEGADTLSCCNETLFTYCAQHMWVRTARAA